MALFSEADLEFTPEEVCMFDRMLVCLVSLLSGAVSADVSC